MSLHKSCHKTEVGLVVLKQKEMVWGGGREEGSGWGARVYLKLKKIKNKK